MVTTENKEKRRTDSHRARRIALSFGGGIVFLCALFCLFGRPGLAQTVLPEADAQTSPEVHPMDFWPKRVSLDAEPVVYVQLSVRDHEVEASLICDDGDDFVLPPPFWSHPDGLVHAFDLDRLELTSSRSCALLVKGNRREFRSDDSLRIKRTGDTSTVRDVYPDEVDASEEGILEIQGTGFPDEVNVVWISMHEPVSFHRSVRTDASEPAGSIVVPFAPELHGAQPGQYLIVVESRDHGTAIWDGFFHVHAVPDPDVREVTLQWKGAHSVVIITGYHLDSIRTAIFRLPGGDLPLPSSRNEGSSMDRLEISLPLFSANNAIRAARVLVDGSRLVFLPDTGSVSDSDPDGSLPVE